MCPLPKPFGHLNLLFCKAVLVKLINADVCNVETLKSQWLSTMIAYCSHVSQFDRVQLLVFKKKLYFFQSWTSIWKAWSSGLRQPGQIGMEKASVFASHFCSQSIGHNWSHELAYVPGRRNEKHSTRKHEGARVSLIRGQKATKVRAGLWIQMNGKKNLSKFNLLEGIFETYISRKTLVKKKFGKSTNQKKWDIVLLGKTSCGYRVSICSKSSFVTAD